METKEFNVGDEVAERDAPYRAAHIAKIVKITETGQIVLDNGNRYKGNGIHLKASISVLTDELRAKIVRHEREEFLKNFDWTRMSDEFLDDMTHFMHNHGFDSIQ